MFCSNCGKTIPPGSESCASCGMVIGSGEFTASAYVASQPRISQGVPEMDAKPRYARYTRTTYTTMEDSDGGDVFRRTSYRPVLEEEPTPASLSEDEEQEGNGAASEEKAPETDAKRSGEETAAKEEKTERSGEEQKASAQSEPVELPESLRAKPLRPVRPTGISEQTQKRMQFLREQNEAREDGQPQKKPAKPVVASLFSGGGRGANTKVPKREIFPSQDEETNDTAAKAETRATRAKPVEDPWEDGENEDVFDTSDIDEDEEAAPRGGLFRRGSSGGGISGIVRTALIAVCVVALLVGGFIWLSMKTAARSPIKGVTYTLFEKGVSELETHASESYRQEILALYVEDPTGATAATKQTEGRAKLQALLPGTPLANDQDFLNAMLAIQTNIENAITLDGLMANDTEGALSALGGSSAERWSAIENAITRLKAATDPMELAAIGESSTFSATPTPEPTPTVSPYTTLTKGMNDNNDVMKMQNRLYDLGWFTDVRDGDFGAVTQTAIKQFQQASGLAVTGIADPDTLAAIYAEDALRTGNRITPPPSAVSTPDPNATETVAPANPN